MQIKNISLWWLILISSSLFAIMILAVPPGAIFARIISNHAWEHRADPEIMQAIYLSLRTTSISAIITLLCGVPLAYLLQRRQFSLKWLINLLIQIPIVLPPSVAGLALLMAFGRRGLLAPIFDPFGISIPFTTAAVILVQVFVSLPFLVRTTQLGLSSIASEIEDAASVDGATGFSMFAYIILPLTRKSILIGLSLAWTRALGEFGATILFAGRLPGTTQTLPLFVYGAFERGEIDAALWAGAILILIAISVIALTFLLTQDNEKTPEKNSLIGSFFA